MSFLEKVKSIAKQNKKTIVLPESLDIRTIEATHQLLAENIANVVLIGDKNQILQKADGFNIENAIFINPIEYENLNVLIDKFVEIRKDKGITPEKAKQILLNDYLYFGVLLVKCNFVDGMVAGAVSATADVLRPCLQIIKTAPNTKIVSAFFLLNVPNCEYGEDGVFVFSDCALNQNPNSEQLASIAKNSADSFKALVGKQPYVAMLSHSSKGSAYHPDVDKVIEAVKIANSNYPEIKIDGEFQLDAAIDKTVAKQKVPNSEIAGNANVLIFPDLDAANIGYKLVQRLAKAEAYGPITQGLAKPVNDLSRGCSAQDIVGVVSITCIQAQNNS